MYRIALILLFTLQATYAQKAVHTSYFNHDSFSLTAAEEQKLRGFIKSLDTLPVQSISIKAFCDDTGSNWYNDVLSYKRAYTLYHYFSEDKRVSFKGFGEIALLQTNSNLSEERKRNRRAEIEVLFDIPVTPPSYESVPVTKDTLVTIENEDKAPKPDYKPLSSGLKAGDRILLKNLIFKGGVSKLQKSSQKELEKLLQILKENPTLKFEIQGHVCCIEWFNKDAIDEDTGISNLSFTRAKAVYDYLLKNGIDPNRMKYFGFGRDFPIEDGPESENKRVEILITAQ